MSSMKDTLVRSLAVAVFFICQVLHVEAFSMMKRPDTATISGRINGLKEGDTIMMNVYKFGEFQGYSSSKAVFISRVRKGSFLFKLPKSEHPQYIDLIGPTSTQLRLNSYIVMPGDRIFIKYVGRKISYSGRGSEKWKLKEEVDELIRNYLPAERLTEKNAEKYIQHFNYHIRQACLKIAKQRKTIGVLVSDILIADLLGGAAHNRYLDLFDMYKGGSSYRPLLQHYEHLSSMGMKLDPAALKYSDYYAFGIIEEYKLDSCFLIGKPFVPRLAYCYFKARLMRSPLLRERILTLLLYTSRTNGLEQSTVDDAITNVKNPLYRKLLVTLRASSANGAVATDFALPDTSGNLVHLAYFRNRVILIDFWFSTCGPCKSLGLILNQLEKRYVGREIVFVSVSVDKSRDRWMKAVRQKQFITEYSINLFTEGKALSHPIAKHYNISGCPTLLLIDRNNKVNNSFTDPHEDNGESLIAAINKMLL